MTTPAASASQEIRPPRDNELDVYGLTHVGRVRPENQDHYLLATIRKRVEVHQTSLPRLGGALALDQRLATLGIVADGVGGGEAGEEASRLALETVTEYVARTLRCYYASDAHERSFINTLQRAANEGHEAVRARRAQLGAHSMATTLTVWLGVWPRIYLLQVGDSRAYVYRDGRLLQLTRDQTLAQELLERGVFTRADVEASPFANVLSSSIGGSESQPVVTRVESDWGSVALLCSDGLTKHVSDERIAERLAAMSSARQVAEQLLQDALDAGGSDNVTLVVGRAVRTEARDG